MASENAFCGFKPPQGPGEEEQGHHQRGTGMLVLTAPETCTQLYGSSAPVMQDFEELAGQVFDSADADGDGQVTKLDLFEFTTDNQVKLACHVMWAGHSKAPLALNCP